MGQSASVSFFPPHWRHQGQPRTKAAKCSTGCLEKLSREPRHVLEDGAEHSLEAGRLGALSSRSWVSLLWFPNNVSQSSGAGEWGGESGKGVGLRLSGALGALGVAVSLSCLLPWHST